MSKEDLARIVEYVQKHPEAYPEIVLPTPLSAERAQRAARKLAIEILSNCAMKYTLPERFMPENPQQSIDQAIAAAEATILRHMAEKE